MPVNEAELRALMLAALAGDGAAYRRLLHSLAGPLRAYFRKRLPRGTEGDRPESEDLVQETLLAIHLKRATYDPRQPLTPWIYAIARYKLVDHLRALRGSRGTVPIDDVADLLATEDRHAGESSADLDKVLAGLPVRVRALIVDTRLHGLSIAEAAERAGMSESAVKVAIHRALKALQNGFARAAP